MSGQTWVYVQSERASDFPPDGVDVFTVGFYRPDGEWEAESDHRTADEAAARVHYLNGGAAVSRVLGEALNSGDGVYRP